MRSLSPRQRDALAAINDWTQEHGRPPTVRELAQALGLTSTATVHQHLQALEAKGYLARRRYSHRGLRPQAPPRQPKPAAAPGDFAHVPLVGVIAAGQPIEAVEVRDEDMVELPASFLSSGEHFALRVRGDSMIEDGIFDGDLIVVRRQDKAEAGQTVVALMDGEATVKRLYFRGEQAELRPANAAMKSLFVPRGELIVQGVVVSLLRRYR